MADPTVEGPIPGVPVLALGHEAAFKDCVIEEFFLTGTGICYKHLGALSDDGKWQVAPAGTAPYTTRVVAIRPPNPAKFNGVRRRAGARTARPDEDGGEFSERSVAVRGPERVDIGRAIVKPLRCAIPAARRPRATILGHTCDVCVAPAAAAGKTFLFCTPPSNVYAFRIPVTMSGVHEPLSLCSCALRGSDALEVARQMAAHESPRTTSLYDLRDDEVAVDEVERPVR